MIVILIFLIMLTIGCSLTSQPSVTKNPKQDYPKIYQRIKDDLENGYHEKFAINKIRYISETDVYVAYCNPVDDKEFVFEARTGGHKYGNSVWDRYGRRRIGHNINQYYEDIIESLFPYEKKVFYVNGGTYSNWDHIPSQKELFDEDHENTYILPHIHIFENVIKKDKDDFLKNVLKLKEKLEEQKLKRSGIYIFIYRGELFEDIDVNWLMNATDVFSNNIDLMKDGYDGHAKYSRFRIYRAEMIYNLKIRSENYKKINSIRDVQEDCVSKTGFKGYKAKIEEVKNSYRNDYLITEEEINDWKESKNK